MSDQATPSAPRQSAAEAARQLGWRIDALTKSLRRHRRWQVATSVAVVLSLWASLQSHTTQNAQDEATMERRVVAVGQRYAGCNDDNIQAQALGRTFDNLFAASARPDLTPDRLRSLSRTLDVLRGELRVSECEAFLVGLTPDEADRARAVAAAIPRHPLPPPTVPGYVPPGTGAD